MFLLQSFQRSQADVLEVFKFELHHMVVFHAVDGERMFTRVLGDHEGIVPGIDVADDEGQFELFVDPAHRIDIDADFVLHENIAVQEDGPVGR